jgi:vacuolar-type H+-ATPase subunit H
MDLIRKIKQAEVQAQQIIEQAKSEAAGKSEQFRQNRSKLLAEAEQQRKRAIEAAVSAAESDALSQVKELQSQAEKQRRKLREKAGGKTATATAKVIEYLRG